VLLIERFQEAAQAIFCVVVEFQEHDAVAELGMAGDDATADECGLVGYRQLDAHPQAHRKLIRQHHAAAVEAQVGGCGGDGCGFVLGLDPDGNLDGVALVEPALGRGDGRFVVRHVA